MPNTAILFVCLGNICRSPLAEAAFRHEAMQAGLECEVDSAGTGAWHVGNPPDPRAQEAALRNGIDICCYRARQIVRDDFYHFSHIFALDQDNFANLQNMAPDDGRAQVMLLLDAVKGREGQSVADPYYGDDDDFDATWADVAASAKALIARLS